MDRKEIDRGREYSTLFMATCMVLMTAHWDIIYSGLLRDDLALQYDSGFGGPVWSSSVEKSKVEEVECLLEAAPLAVGAGAEDLDGAKAKHPGVFMELLRDRQRFMNLGRSSVDNVECRCTCTAKRRKVQCKGD